MYTALTNICRHGHPDDNPWAWGLGHSLVPALARVRSIMAFGLGPPDHPEYGGTDACASVSTSGRRYISQHLAAVAMAHALGRLHPDAGALPIHAQDPAYSPQAAAFLSDVGINVVDGCGARAFTMIDDDCLVYACGPNAPVRQIVAEIARPAVLVWDRARPPPYRADQDPYAMDLAFNK